MCVRVSRTRLRDGQLFGVNSLGRRTLEHHGLRDCSVLHCDCSVLHCSVLHPVCSVPVCSVLHSVLHDKRRLRQRVRLHRGREDLRRLHDDLRL